MPKEIIGIIGTIGAGKDVAGDYIAKKLEIPCFQISYPLKQICSQTGISPTRENLIALGTKLAAKHGEGYLAQYILERAPNKAVITGMRQLGQITILKSLSKLTLISIDADPKIRFKRTQQNGKLGEANSLKQFIARETAENSHPNVQRLFDCMQLADHKFTNQGSLEHLHAQLDAFLQQYKYEKHHNSAC